MSSSVPSSAQDPVLLDTQDGVATITLNRPKTLNAFNGAMVKGAIKAFKSIKSDPSIRAVILTGSGRGFSSGQDLKEGHATFTDAAVSVADSLTNTYHVLIEQMVTLEKPIIGMINGVAAGIGMSIALATDIRIASENASFSLGFSKIGLIPDGGVNWVLTRTIGYSRAYEMAITAEPVSADQALAWGMVNHIVPHEQLADFSTAYTRKLAEGPTLAFGLTKRVMRRSFDQTFAENLAYEAPLQELASRSADSQEGILAFIEKRKAQYSGK